MGSFIFRMARRKRAARWGRLPAAGLWEKPAAFMVPVFSKEGVCRELFRCPRCKNKKKILVVMKIVLSLHPLSRMREEGSPERQAFLENGAIAQLVEQRTENPCVTGSIPVRATWR